MHQHKDVINLLKTTRGQIDGIIKMVEEDRYCVDVSKQLLSVQGLIKKINLKILDNHIRSCVHDAMNEGSAETKIDEVMDILSRYAR